MKKKIGSCLHEEDHGSAVQNEEDRGSAVQNGEGRGLTGKKRKSVRRRVILSLLAVLLAGAVTLLQLTPVPVSMATRFMFRNGPATAPENYEQIKDRVAVVENIAYLSEYPENLADVYTPTDLEGPYPVVLWVHGGAFVGGDKKDAAIFATALASEGIAVVCMNYARAPEKQYPVPVRQVEEAYRWMKSVSGEYSLDLNRLVLAGDSAGAQIAAQFSAIQSNPDYADEMGFNAVVPSGTLRALLLYCGPYSVLDIGNIDSLPVKFVIESVAWAYFGARDWKVRFSDQATIQNHVTADFPPTFISDGNTLSFEEHGRSLADSLRLEGVVAETFFVPAEEEKTPHEYQFVMNTPAGEEVFQKTAAFIKRFTDGISHEIPGVGQ